MSDVETSCSLGPFTPTYMPYFPPHRSALLSSSNTRQRDDYELGSQLCSSSPSPQVLVTSEDEEDCDVFPAKTDRITDSYPASELPFASEPALEGELEQGLPALKKLKPDSDFDTVDTQLVKNPAQGILLIGTVKGILTRRTSTTGDSSPMPQSPIITSPLAVDTCFIPWSRSLCNGTKCLSTLTTSSAPLSRRSSSGASSVCTGSLKAVRFASGNLTTGSCGSQQTPTILPGEIEGPVAAVMYLTHSAEAYDRSPIVVEDGLRLPPRAKPEDEIDESPTPLDKKRRTKLNLELRKFDPHRVSIPPQALCSRLSQTSPISDTVQEETSIIIKAPALTSSSYREVEEVDEEEEETVGPDSITDERDTVDEDEEEQQHDGSVEEEISEDDVETETALDCHGTRVYNTEKWGLGKWSSGEVFGCCDALGGF